MEVIEAKRTFSELDAIWNGEFSFTLLPPLLSEGRSPWVYFAGPLEGFRILQDVRVET
jgi:hypothetical protein